MLFDLEQGFFQAQESGPNGLLFVMFCDVLSRVKKKKRAAEDGEASEKKKMRKSEGKFKVKLVSLLPLQLNP